MEHVEVVIKIPEYYLTHPQDYICLAECVRRGVLLPRGHGKLIDYSWVVDNVIKKLGIKDERYLLEAEKALMSIIEIAPTIIEADKE